MRIRISAMAVAVTALIAGGATSSFAQTTTGNGAPRGSHYYQLNIQGKTNCSGDDLTGSNRRTIQVLLNFDDGNNTGQTFANLDRTNKIFLAQGDFAVLDGNACDANGAKFQLPANPFTCPATDPECLNTDPTFQNYTVWVRALAKPGGSATMTTCAVDSTGTVVCSEESVLLVRDKGQSKFTNKTKELTTIRADIGNGTQRIGIFSDALQDYFWDFDNRGLRLAQIRFYPIAD